MRNAYGSVQESVECEIVEVPSQKSKVAIAIVTKMFPNSDHCNEIVLSFDSACKLREELNILLRN